MPVYNGGGYFELALKSAIAQTFEDIEIVIVNDGSTDGGATEAVALKYAAIDRRIIYISQDNAGVAGALNTFMKHATGEYFAWLSHDDLFLPHKIKSQLSYHLKIANKNASLFSNYALIDQNGELLCEVNQDFRRLLDRPALSLLRGAINGCTLLIPMHVLREHGLFDTRLRYTQDYDFWGRILSKYDFFLQPEVLVHYRVHAGQDSHKPAAVTEGDALWKRLLEDRTDAEKVQLFGSRKNYYYEMGEFLAETPYKNALAFAQQRAISAGSLDDTLISIVLPFLNEIELVLRAAASALSQTHCRIELLLIDDGSTELLEPVIELLHSDDRVRLFRQPNRGAAEARNLGLRVALGEYIAFLDADDVFLPKKIETQLAAMQEVGALFSHTSYFVNYLEKTTKREIIHSGRFSGLVYPEIIARCPIAPSTVMFHSILVAEGYRFPSGYKLGEDVILWTTIAQRHEILGLEEPLSDLEWDIDTAAINKVKMQRGCQALIDYFKKDPVHSRYTFQISNLEIMLLQLDASAECNLPRFENELSF
jgi:glycosyltransferase involved in cell wall biosynthesis